MVAEAKDYICHEEGCGAQAVAFWPANVPEIPPHPWCRKHLNWKKEQAMNALANLTHDH